VEEAETNPWFEAGEMSDRLHILKPVRIVLLLITILLFLPKVSLAGQFKVTRVYDGDTVKAVRG
jgi:hypothetical protein